LFDYDFVVYNESMDMKVEDLFSKINYTNKERDFTYREIFLRIISTTDYQINIKTFDDDEGKIAFSVSAECFGFNYDYVKRHQNKIFSNFFANFLGDFLVRENIDRFAKLVTNMNFDKYNNAVNSREHKNFGLDFSNNSFILTFHVSLIQNILFDEIRHQMKTIM